MDYLNQIGQMKRINETIEKISRGEDMEIDQYMEHEIKLRLHDYRFKIIENKLNWIISLIIGGMAIPIFLHFSQLV